DMMKKMEKQETPSSSPKKSDSNKQHEYTRNSFDYSKMQGNFSSNFISVPLGKAPLLDGLNYVDWGQQDEDAFNRFASKSLGSCECRCSNAQEWRRHDSRDDG